MNRSKLIEWLLENDCPFDFQIDESSSYSRDLNECPLLFSEKGAYE